MLSKKDRGILIYFSANDVSVSPRPFEKAAKELGMPEAELLKRAKALKKKGVIKNLRGVINHRKAGYKNNALIAWRIDGPASEKQDDIVSGFFTHDDRISHCYRRKPHEKFPYNIFTMMHARSRKEIRDFAGRCAGYFDLEHEILFTEKELKKEKLSLGSMLC